MSIKIRSVHWLVVYLLEIKISVDLVDIKLVYTYTYIYLCKYVGVSLSALCKKNF